MNDPKLPHLQEPAPSDPMSFKLFSRDVGKASSLRDFATGLQQDIRDMGDALSFGVRETGAAERVWIHGMTGLMPDAVENYDAVLNEYQRHYEYRNFENQTTAAQDAFNRLQYMHGSPLTVNSAYRDPEHNARVGGAPNSMHTHGKAFDIDVSGMDQQQRENLLRQAMSAGFTGIGVYDNAMHFDVGPERSWGPSHGNETLPDYARAVINEGVPTSGDMDFNNPIMSFAMAEKPAEEPAEEPSQFAQNVDGFLDSIYGTDPSDMTSEDREDRRRAVGEAVTEGLQAMTVDGGTADYAGIAAARQSRGQARQEQRVAGLQTQNLADMMTTAGLGQYAGLAEIAPSQAAQLLKETIASRSGESFAPSAADISMAAEAAVAAGNPMLGERLTSAYRSGNIQLTEQLFDETLGLSPQGTEEQFSISQEGVDLAVQAANDAGNPMLGQRISSAYENNNTPLLEQLLDESYSLEPQIDEEDPFNRNTFDQLMSVLDTRSDLSPNVRRRAEAIANLAASEEEATVRDDYISQFNDIMGAQSPMATALAADLDNLLTGPRSEVFANAQALGQTGTQAMGIAANTEFNPNRLKGQFIDPIARIMRGLPGGQQFAEQFLDFSSTDAFGNSLLTALRNGSIAQLSAGIAGQLSNLEGDRILSRIADGTAERGEIMALGQALMVGAQRDMAERNALLNYQQRIYTGEEQASTDRRDQLVTDARNSVADFDIVNNVKELFALQDQYLGEEDPDNFAAIPPEIRGRVVKMVTSSGGFRYVPLFGDVFFDANGEYKDIFSNEL